MECLDQEYCPYCKYFKSQHYSTYDGEDWDIWCENKPENKDYKQACAKAARYFYFQNECKYLYDVGKEKLIKAGRSPNIIKEENKNDKWAELRIEKEIWDVTGFEKLFEYWKTDEKGIKHYYIDKEADEKFFIFDGEYSTITEKEIKKMKKILKS